MSSRLDLNLTQISSVYTDSGKKGANKTKLTTFNLSLNTKLNLMICKKCELYFEELSQDMLCPDCEAQLFKVEENLYQGDKDLVAHDTLTDIDILVLPQYSQLFCEEWIDKNKHKYPELIFKIQ